MAKIKLPTKRRKYHSIYELDKGLDYSKPSTGIAEANTPNCEEVLFRYKEVQKAKGTEYFAGTEVHPLDSAIMHIDQYYKTTGADKLIIHTLTDVLYYDTTTERMMSIVTTPWKNLICRVSAVVPATKNLVCQVIAITLRKNLVCRVIVWALHKDLVCRITVPSIAATTNLVCRISAVVNATKNLVCQVTSSTIVKDLPCTINILSAG